HPSRSRRAARLHFPLRSLRGPREDQVVPAARDAELRATVLGPRLLVAAGIQRPGLAEALRLEARRVEPEAHEVLFDRVRPAQPQCDVILDRAALVRLPLADH